MGLVTSKLPQNLPLLGSRETENPKEYFVHGIHYWPGKPTPYKLWNTLLPDQMDNIRSLSSLNDNSALVEHNVKLTTTTTDNTQISTKKCGKSQLDAYNNNGHSQLNSDVNETELTVIKTKEVELTIVSDNGIEKCDDKVESIAIINEQTVKTEDRWKHYNYPFENIALSGGGMKGYAYIGAVKALEDGGVMPHIKRFVGSSSGAMCAAALSLGYSAQEICRCFFVDLDEVFNDQTCCVICSVPKLYTRYGIHPAKKFFEGYGLVIAAKAGGNQDLTFKQHHEMFGKELCIVVCNITKMTTEYCHYTTTPDLPIREAVRMSMAVPVVYEPATRTVDGQVNYYIDGSTGDHFPIHCFDGPTVGPNSKEPENGKTLGFYVLSEKDTEHVMWMNSFGKEIPNKPTYMPDTKLARDQLKDEIKKRKKAQKDFDEKTFIRQLEKFSRMSLETLGMKHYEAPNKTHINPSNILDYLVANLELLLNTQVVYKMKPKDEQRTIPINVGYMETHNYDVEPADREFMLKQGYASAKAHLQTYVANETNKKQNKS